MYPDYFACSSSEDGEYGHPSPETVMMIWAQMRHFKQLFQKDTTREFVETPWLCTSYPKWLISMDGLTSATLPAINGFRTDAKAISQPTKKSSGWFQAAVKARMKNYQGPEKDPFKQFMGAMDDNQKTWKVTKKRPKAPDKIKQENYDAIYAAQPLMQPRWKEMAADGLKEHLNYAQSKTFWIELRVGQLAKVTTQGHGMRLVLLSTPVTATTAIPPVTTTMPQPVIDIIAPKDGLTGSKEEQDRPPPSDQPGVKKFKIDHQDTMNQDYEEEAVKILVQLKHSGDVQVGPDMLLDSGEESDDDPEAQFDPLQLRTSTEERTSSKSVMTYQELDMDVNTAADMKGDDDDDPHLLLEEDERHQLGPTRRASRASRTLAAASRTAGSRTLTLAVRTLAGAPAEPPGPYLLVSNAYRGATFRYDADKFAMLTDKTVFDMFVRRLPSSFVVVNRRPNSGTTTTTTPGTPPGTGTAAETLSLLYEADKWARCLVPGALGIQSVDLACVIDPIPGTARYSATVSSMTAKAKLGGKILEFKNTSTATKLDAVDPEGILNSKLATDHAYLYLPVVIPAGSPFAAGFSLGDIVDIFAPPWLKVDLGSSLPGTTKFALSPKKEDRSGLYLVADNEARSCLRLDFNATSAATDVVAWLKEKGILPLKTEIQNLGFTVFQQGTGLWMTDSCHATKKVFCQFTGSITISGTPVDFRVRLQPGQATLSIRFPRDIKFSGLFRALRDALDFGNEASDLSEDSVKDLAPPRKDNTPVDLGLYRLDLAVGKGIGWNLAATMRLKVLGTMWMTTVSFPNPRIRADLWTEAISDFTTSSYLPWFDDWTVCVPPNLTDMTGEIALKSLEDVPDGPDTSFMTLREAHFEAAKQPGGGVYLDLYARIDLGAPRFDFPMVWPKFFSVHGVYDKALGPGNWKIDLHSRLYLPKKASDTKQLPAELELTASVSNQGWTFQGTATELDFMSLYSYFDDDANDTVMDLLSGIGIPWISLRYDHNKVGPSTLGIDGILQIKKFALDFHYLYSKTKGAASQWQLTAGLRAAKANPDHSASLLDIIAAFIPGDDPTLLDLGDIPFFKDVGIKPAETRSNLDPIMFSVSASPKAVIMWLRVELVTPLVTISVLFVQYKYKAPTGSGSGTRDKTANMKRFIRVRFDQLPSLQGVPIVGQIPSPVDSLDYVYVKDNTVSTPGGTNKMPGLTRDEIAEINLTLDPSVAVTFKEQTSAVQGGNARPSMALAVAGGVGDVKPALRAGHHFMVMSDGTLVLDHIFGANATNNNNKTNEGGGSGVGGGGSGVGGGGGGGSGSGSGSGSGGSGGSAGAAAITPTQAESGSTYGAQKKSAGGLSITGVGIKVKDSYVYILIDGSLRLGPIEVAAEGLGIGLPLSKMTKPKDLQPGDFKLMLSGLGVMYNQPPILIAGGFKMDKGAGYELYIGGLVISIPPYSITAVGAYRKSTSPDFKSVFIYGRLNGPLFTVGFADVSGVAVSFGYNYRLRSPSAADVENFPLLSRQGPEPAAGASNPLDMIIGSSPSSFSSWLQAEQDTFYFSVGLKADACQVLTVEAALVFALGGFGLKASVVGRATAQLPPASSKSPITFVYAELGIVATVDATSFVVEAQLSSNSFVMNPFCRIRGGFALAFWYGDSPHAGDWVFSVGGYHPAFVVPKHWPNPPRLGIAWELSSQLRIGGEGFFAVTPKAVMGGAHMFATFRAGPIYADFEAWASFLLNYKPLFFVAEIGLRITVGARINLGLIHIDISGSVGADLYLRGPPFGGYVGVDFKIVHFKIYFGPRDPKPAALSFEEFVDAVAKPGLSGGAPSGTDGADKATVVVVALSAGAATEAQKGYDQKTGQRWFVRAGAFRFRVESKFAVGDAFLYSGVEGDPEHRDDATALGKGPIYSRLTHNPLPLKSTLTIKVTRGGGGVQTDGNPWRVLPFDKSLPKGMWAQCRFLLLSCYHTCIQPRLIPSSH